jgi:hypothetical protein
MCIQYLYCIHPSVSFPYILSPPTGTNSPQAGPPPPSCYPIL